MILLWFCLFQFAGAVDFSVNDKNSYGPYITVFKKFELCEQAQSFSQTDVSLDQNYLVLNVNVTKPCTLSKSKSRISVTAIKGGVSKPLFRYNLKDPCMHFLIGPLLRDNMQVKRNCRIEKGNYGVSLNLTQLFDVFFGQSFFYGSYEFKSVISCTAGTLICVFSGAEIVNKNHDI